MRSPRVVRVAVAADEALVDRLARVLPPATALTRIRSRQELRDALSAGSDLVVVNDELAGDLAQLARDVAAHAPAVPLVVVQRADVATSALDLNVVAATVIDDTLPDEELRETLLDQAFPWSHPAPWSVVSLLDDAGIAYSRLTPAGVVVDANRATAAMVGRDAAADVFGIQPDPFEPPPGEPRTRWLVGLGDGDVPAVSLNPTPDTSGAVAFCEADASTIVDARGDVAGYELLLFPMTRDESHRRVTQFQALALEQLSTGAIGLDTSLRVTCWNTRAAEIYGWTATEAMGRHLFDFMDPSHTGTRAASVTDALVTSGACEFESDDIRRDGSRICVHKWLGVVRDENGTPIGCVVALDDVTATRRKERLLQRTLADYESLLKEVHHRVKNNLQVVAGLLSIQARRVPPAQQAALQDCQERVHALSVAHELIYRHATLEHLELPEYLARLIDCLAAWAPDDVVTVRGAMPSCTVGVDAAIAAGLVLCDVVMAIRRQVVAARACVTLTVATRVPRPGRCELRISDDYPWPWRLPESVRAHAATIGGAVTVRRSHGNVVTLRFPTGVTRAVPGPSRASC